MKDKKYILTESQLKYLHDSWFRLRAMQHAGVDNWQGGGYMWEPHFEKHPELDDVDDIIDAEFPEFAEEYKLVGEKDDSC
jgi:hypothetical protein